MRGGLAWGSRYPRSYFELVWAAVVVAVVVAVAAAPIVERRGGCWQPAKWRRGGDAGDGGG